MTPWALGGPAKCLLLPCAAPALGVVGDAQGRRCSGEAKSYQPRASHHALIGISSVDASVGKGKNGEKGGKKTPTLKFRASSAVLVFGSAFVFTNGALGNLGNPYFKGLPPPPGLCKAVGIYMPGAGLAAVSLPSYGFIILHLLRVQFIPSN